MPFIEIYGNIVIPALSAVFLFMYFLYFLIIDESKSESTRYFIVFLISFCLFLLGRPIQILSGSHPIPLIINNIRSFLFAAVTVPMIMLADFSRPGKGGKRRFWILVITGSVLGAVYCIFNSLTTAGSAVIFTLGSLSVIDSVTPLMTPPYYGREVTIAVYLTIAALLFTDSLVKIRRATKNVSYAGLNLPRVYLFNGGKLVFALTFFLGSLLQQWWIYYVGSLISVITLGYAVAFDIRDRKNRMKKVISFIKEDLIQDLSVDAEVHNEVMDILSLLQIPRDINTFIIRQEPGAARQNTGGSRDGEKGVVRELSAYLQQLLGENQFILIPVGTDKTGICLSVEPGADFGRAETIALCEGIIREVAASGEGNIGIGRSYSGIDELRKSYQEALTAVEYASRIDGGQVVHIADIQDGEARVQYPLKEKAAFLTAIRMGDRDIALAQLEELTRRLFSYGNDRDRLAKVRIYELLGAMIEAAISGGGNVDELLEISERYYNEAVIIRSRGHLLDWLKTPTEEIIGLVSRSHSNRYDSIVRKAMKFIEEHFAEAISVKDVADEVCVSESYFKSIFKKTSGYSYSEYLTRVRMDKAKELLHSTQKTVTEIAMEVGFHTPTSFSTLFRREVGMSPTQYKNQLANA
jgi:two-component system response regulator YesN